MSEFFSPIYVITAIAIMGAITFVLRALPFVAGLWLQRWPLVHFLARFLPPAIMLLLVMHTVLGLSATYSRGVVLEILSLALVLALHLWRGHALLSIVGGTAVYVFFLNFF